MQSCKALIRQERVVDDTTDLTLALLHKAQKVWMEKEQKKLATDPAFHLVEYAVLHSCEQHARALLWLHKEVLNVCP